MLIDGSTPAEYVLLKAIETLDIYRETKDITQVIATIRLLIVYLWKQSGDK